MSAEIADPTSTVPPPAATKNVFARLIGVLFSPEETFRDIVRKPNVLAPIVILIVLGYVFTALVMPIADWNGMAAAQGEQMRAQNPNIDDATLEKIEKGTAGFIKVMFAIGPFVGIIMWLILAGVLFLAFRLMGGEGTFGQAFAIVVYSWLPQTINAIVVAIVAYARGSFNPITMATLVKSNLGFLVDMKTNPGLFALLSSIDLFTIWTLILLTIGFAIMSRFSKAKSATIVVSLWLLLVLGKSGMSALGGMKR